MLFTFTSLAVAQDEPPRGLGELEAYSVFVDSYQSDDYQLAIDYGEWMLEAKPREIRGYENFSLERQFDRMINVYIGAAEEEDDPTTSAEYLQDAEDVFEMVFETFSEDEIDYFEWHLQRGRFYHENHENLDASMEDAVEDYEAMYDVDPQRFVNESDGFYARVLLTEYADNDEREKALAMIDEIGNDVPDDLQETIGEVRESFFESPEERIEYLESTLTEAEGAEREEILRNLLDLYEESGQGEKASETALELYDINPDFVNTRNVADIHLSEGNYTEATEFLQEAMELAESDDDQKEISLEIAESYQQLEQYEEARDYARQAIEIDENYGAAYLRIAAIYASTISDCTGGETLEREDRAVYWLVIDYLEQAKEVDPSLASQADSRAESYREAMPTSEDKFFSDWEGGDSFQINGELSECYAWVNETTTVR